MEPTEHQLALMKAHLNKLSFLVEQKNFVLGELKEIYAALQKEIRVRKESQYSNLPQLFIVSALALGCMVIGAKWLNII